MVNPVYVYKACAREVYFPKNNTLTGKIEFYGGEEKEIKAPYVHFPIYIRIGKVYLLL